MSMTRVWLMVPCSWCWLLFLVYEMVHCACELSGRTPVDHLTFGEFCILVTSLRRHYARKSVWNSVLYLLFCTSAYFTFQNRMKCTTGYISMYCNEHSKTEVFAEFKGHFKAPFKSLPPPPKCSVKWLCWVIPCQINQYCDSHPPHHLGLPWYFFLW